MEDYDKHIIDRRSNGNITYEYYSLNGEYHRIDGPALIGYHRNGNIRYEIYFLNGKEHRIDKPAHIEYYGGGCVKFEDYYLFGKQINEDDFKTPGFIDAFILEHS